MTFLHAVVLSLLQGVTEFLPVSSSGHLVLGQALLEGDVAGAENVRFAVLVHLGTLGAVLWVFRERVGRLLAYALGEGWQRTRRDGWREAWWAEWRGRMIVAVVLACIPTGVIGLTGRRFFEQIFSRPDYVGWALCATGVLLALTGLRRTPRSDADASFSEPAKSFPLWAALVIGVVQGLAIIPGISRSGSTISAAILLGLNRRLAGEFSFLIFIPAMLGAVVDQLLRMDPAGAGLSAPAGLAALAVSALSGWFFLRLLLRLVSAGQLAWFSLYCLAVGLWAIVHF